MAHADHFLQRLERIEMASEVDFALALYRDRELISYVLDKAHLPEGTSRVALSLSEGERGPYIIVERDGEFVTCLGEGMKHDLPMIKRGHLDHFVNKAEYWRQQHKNADVLLAKKDGMKRLLTRMLSAGGAFGREEFQALALWMPLFRPFLVELFFDHSQELWNASPKMYGLSHKKMTAARREKIHLFANRTWALGHIGLLLGNDERSVWEDILEKGPILLTGMPAMMNGTGMTSIGLRGAWVAAKFGRFYLDSFEDEPPPLLGKNDLLGQLMCLTAVGLRHRKLRGRVRKLLPKLMENLIRPNRFEEALKGIHENLSQLADQILTHPEPFTEAALDNGRSMFVKLAEDQLLPPSLPHFSAPKDVPEELALPLGVNFTVPYMEPPENMIMVFAVLSWVARAKAEELYLPKKLSKALFEPWDIGEGLLCIKGIDTFRRHNYAQRNDAKIGRNQSCPCGSGLKYKHCCGKPGAEKKSTPPEPA